ncbi:flagellar hook-length control protein FliK [Alkaliphilus peptidifermentans]|uniref:Hook-length control protein FliK n=1 Tax=Alkaliphilus peptidifermentans DSM 18978 TaxID=1120976 RepID=A0A1G5DHK0_9FIRM|nr:flagellar hook-length control protein FliK [Alkaliphilus peptidifermentans]SCY14195.1 hook-length control protein FliK [Alkaliphilus peptidifermentans DSM 18978]
MMQIESLLFSKEVPQQPKSSTKNDSGDSFVNVLSRVKSTSEAKNYKSEVKDSKEAPAKEAPAKETQAIENDPKEVKVKGETNKTNKETPVCDTETEKDEIILPDNVVILQLINQLEELVSEGILNEEDATHIKEAILALNNDNGQLETIISTLENKVNQLNEEIKSIDELITISIDSFDEKNAKKVPLEKAIVNLEEFKDNLSTSIPLLNEVVGETPVNTVNLDKELQFSQLEEMRSLDPDLPVKEAFQETVVQKPIAEEGKINIKVVSSEEDKTDQLNFDIHQSKEAIAAKITSTIQQSTAFVDPEDIIHQVVNKMEVLVLNHKSEMKLQLSPENLGSLTIKITVEEGVLTGKVFAENPQVKELIENNLNQLKINLGEKGISVSSLEVSVGQNQQEFARGNAAFYQRQKLRKNTPQAGGLANITYAEGNVAVNPYLTPSKFDGVV